MENGRNDAFPAGLRVLVVDDDPTWLKILEKMLKKCSYEVTKCCLATEALDMLRKRKDGFDIVISDVNMPDMDGFRLLEHVGLEMNLPVIMMSVDGEISRVMKGVLHGACDYLLKPIRMKELQNIWQHVLRKKIHGVKDIDFYEGSEGIQRMKNGLDTLDDSQLLAGGDLSSPRKRKDSDNYELDDQDFSDAAAKRARVVWSVDLHQKFVNAVNQIGLDKVGPKKILDLMNVPWLTRENVASHLQKYRLYLSRLQNQGQPSFGATKQSDFSGLDPGLDPDLDPSPSFSFQSSTAVQQNNATSCSFGYSGNKMLVQDVSPEIQEVNSKVHVPILTATKSRRALTVDIPCLQNVDSGFGMGVSSSFGSGRNVNYTSLEPNTLPQYSWSEDNSMIQFTQPPKEHKQLRYIPGQKHHIQADLMQPSSSADKTLFSETVPPSDMKPLGTAYRNNHMRIVSPTAARGVDFVPVRPQTDTVNIEALNHVSTSIIPSSMKNSNFDQCCTANWGSRQNHSTMGNIGSPVNGTAGSSEMKPSCTLYRNNHVRIISPKADTLDHVPLRSQTNSVNAEGLNKMSMNLNPSLDHCHTANWGTQQHQSASSSEMKRFSAAYANNHVGIASPAEDKAEPVCVQPQSNSVNTADQNKMGTSIASPGLKPLSFDQSSTRTTNWGNQYHHSTVETGPILASFEGGLHLPSLIDQGYIDDSGFSPLGFSDYLDPDLVTDVPSHLLDTLRFNSDLVFDSLEYPIINEGLFIT